MRASTLTALSLAALVASVGACAPPAQIRYERRLEETAPPASHAVHSTRLAQLMRGVERLADERLPKALDAQEEVGRRTAEVSSVARDLAASAAQIPDAIAGLALSEEERGEFRALADALRMRALELADLAPQLAPDDLRARAEAIEESCNACHGLFRVETDSLQRM